jgi:alanine-synthesizing transaminase
MRSGLAEGNAGGGGKNQRLEQPKLQKRPVQPSARSKYVQYSISDLIARTGKLHKEIIYLNIGDPVKFGFQIPRHIRDELIKSVERGFNFYSDSEGLPEVREAIAER